MNVQRSGSAFSTNAYNRVQIKLLIQEISVSKVQFLYFLGLATRVFFIALVYNCFLGALFPLATNCLCARDALISTPAPAKPFLISTLLLEE